ncbi:MAG: hypothetical protein ABIR79_24665 [Candidatus Binatia bacterium]
MTASTSPAARLLRMTLTDVLLPCGVALATGATVASVVPAHWQTIGAPYFLGYGKNVEGTAVAAALAAGALTPLLADRRAWLGPLAILAIVGWAALSWVADLGLLAAGTWRVLTAASLTLVLRLQRPESPARTVDESGDLSRGVTLLAVVTLALTVFMIALEALVIDVFHHGEVLTSALDLLRGGRPFESFIWPHGLHDTGLAAGWIWATGKVGTSPVALSRATCRALAIVTAYALGRVMFGSRHGALAVAGGLAAATVAASVNAHGVAQAQGMHHLGIVVFVAVGFAALAVPSHGRLIVAGGCFALAHLFRIEVGVFAVIAAGAVTTQRHLMAREHGFGPALVGFVTAGLQMAAGAALVLATCALLFDWPAGAWLEYTLRELPRHHRDAVGLPFPWPLAHGRIALHPDDLYPVALGWLAFVLFLLGQTVRALFTWRDRTRTAHLVFLAVFAWLATRSSLDRSDQVHVLQWSLLPLIGTLTLALAIVRERFRWSPRRTAVVTVLVLVCFDAARMAWHPLASRRIVDLPGRVASAASLLVEHLVPNPPVGDCADRMFTPAESRISANARFIADTCATEHLLASHHISRFVIQHSAPWYEVRFGQPHTTRFFAFARAYTPTTQSELVGDLRATGAQALLRVRGYEALTIFDVADGVRVPVTDAYLRARRRDVAPVSTPIGEWFFWDEAASCGPSSADAGGPAVEAFIDRMVYIPQSEMLAAEGWSADLAGGRPFAHVGWSADDPVTDGDLDYGIARPHGAGEQQAPALERTGWRLVVRVPAATWKARRENGSLSLDATSMDGRHARATLPFATATELPRLGAEWDDAVARMNDAALQGRRDREAACGRLASGQACACPAAGAVK